MQVTLAFVRSLYLARSAHLSETESTDGNGVGQDEEASSQSPVEGEQEWYDRYGNADDHDAFFWDAEVSRSASVRSTETRMKLFIPRKNTNAWHNNRHDNPRVFA